MTEMDRSALARNPEVDESGNIQPQDRARDQVDLTNSQAGIKGYSAPYGQSVEEDSPSTAGNVSVFTPNWMCALYIKVQDDRSITTRIWYVNWTHDASNEDDIRRELKILLAAMRDNDNSNVGAVRTEDNLDKFGFGSQHLVAVFIDNDKSYIRFNEDYGVGYVVRFTEFSGINPQLRKMMENHTFFNLRKVILSTATPLESDTSYVMEYWNTDERGNDLGALDPLNTTTHYIYSMNIHLAMAIQGTVGTGQVGWVPLVIDPDTGNMGSRP